MVPAMRSIVLALVLSSVALSAQAPTPAGVPTDLRPLLTPKRSEMFLVAQRYALDRTTLNSNYSGPGNARGGGAGGRGGAPAAPAASLSTARLSRLKRFDLDWQTALTKLNGR